MTVHRLPDPTTLTTEHDSSWSVPETPDPAAGASAAERYRSLVVPDPGGDQGNVPLGDLLGPLRPLEETPATNWRRGAEGEKSTASLLAPLRHLGWTVLHDRRLPGSPANLDHLVIGPGVVVVDSKAYRGRIKLLGDGRLWYGRTCMDEVLNVVRWIADEVTDVLAAELAAAGCHVHALLCIHGALLPRSPLPFDGVVLSTPETLLECVLGTEPALTATDIESLSSAATGALIARSLRQTEW
ncbi:MAG TPA: nuclease-related domain-containing protein [Acidimicrobiales bacterium]|nr:nuclease-related domain-containing protein [Acidimicrobiales bacterium]